MEDNTPRPKIRYKDITIEYTPLKDVVDYLARLLEEYPSSIVDITYGDDYLNTQIYWHDYETEEEVRIRLEQESSSKNYRKQQYEALKKEFG